MPGVSVLLVLLPLILATLVAGFRAPMQVLLPLYALTVPLGSTFSVPGLPPEFGSGSSLVGLTLTGALAVRLLLIPSSRQLPGLPTGVWLSLLALAVCSTVWSISTATTVTALQVLTSLVLLYGLVAMSQAGLAVRKRLELALVTGGVAVSLWGILQTLTNSLPTSEASGPRFGRDLLGPNHTAAALLLPLAIALSRLEWARTARGRVAYGASVAALVAAITLSGSRGGLVGAGMTFLVFAVFSRRPRLLLLSGAVVAAVVGGVIVADPGGIGSRQLREGSSGRTDIWQVGLTACRRDCPLGTGWGTFGVVYERTQSSVPTAKVLRRGTTYEPHNIFLLLAIEAGVTGLVLLLAGLVLTARQAWKLPAHLRAPPLAALAGLVTSGFFLSNFEFKYFWMTLIYVTVVNTVHRSSLAPQLTAAVPEHVTAGTGTQPTASATDALTSV
ncbi:MAG TPA: O-antigen ligase family protein [Actinomycetales bacterium]|nr:O-antigen ligase family protein [Actinomycetales bacterium]